MRGLMDDPDNRIERDTEPPAMPDEVARQVRSGVQTIARWSYAGADRQQYNPCRARR
jgi:hypothetical protein